MTADQIVSDIIPSLKPGDSGAKALDWMNEFKVNHLPIVKKKKFIGLISEEDILDFSDPQKPIKDHELSLRRPTVKEEEHIFDVIKVFSGLNLSLVPVVTKEDEYVGVISQENVIDFLASLSSLKDPGGILILEINTKDYVLSEIVRIVETNDAHVLSLYLDTIESSSKVRLTLKVNKTDLKHIIATFERFDYKVKVAYQESPHVEDVKERFDSLMKYLNI